MKHLTLFSISVLICLQTSAQGFRKYSNEFLNIGIGGRGLAMSGAQVATVSDVTSGYWNPAGAMKIKGTVQASIMHTEYFAGIAKFDYAAVSLPIADGEKRIGFSLIRFGIDDIPNTLFLVQPDGSLNYDNITSFSAADYAFNFSYAMNSGVDGLTLGGNAKVVHRILGPFANSWGFGVDIGAQYELNNWRFGAVLKDVIPTFNAWSFNFTDAEKQVLFETGNVIPTSSVEVTAPKLVLGSGYNFKVGKRVSILPEIDLDVTTDGKRNVLISAKPFSIDPKGGVEIGYMKTVYLRAGLGNFQRMTDDLTGEKITSVQPNMGLGIRIKNLTIDYALTNIGNFSQPFYSNVFSLKINLGEPALSIEDMYNDN